MVLVPPPGSPEWMRVTAAGVLLMHVSGGVGGISSGFLALAAKKGGRLHRLAGNVFFASMLVMAGVGTVVAALFPQWTSVVGGLFALYLVITAWASARRGDGRATWIEWAAFPLVVIVAVLSMSLGLEGMASPDGRIEGLPYQPSFVFAALAALAAAYDIRVILGAGIVGAPRVARHLWRMLLALFVAAGSLFLGQPKVFPPSIRHSPWLFAPEILILAALVYWMVRVRVWPGLRDGFRRVHWRPPFVASLR
ncbi:MAG TPA: hypothetical protein VGG68_05390 [Caulobacteraceae bacterium]